MRKWGLVLSVAALVVIVGLGCAKKSKSDKNSGALTLQSSANPTPGTRENSELPFEVTLSANRGGAVIYFTSGASPTTPTTSSTVFDPANPITIDTGFASQDYVIKFFAWYQDPASLNIELEYPNEVTYRFREDINPPSISMTPAPGAYGDPGAITITLTASDTHDSPSQITIKYTTTNDGTTPEDPRTASSPQTGTGDGATVAWTTGTLRIRAFAEDQAGNSSTLLEATYSVDPVAAAQMVMGLINQDRANQSPAVDPLTWDSGWAGWCATHSKVVYDAEQAGTVVKPAGTESEGMIPHWYSSDDERQLVDYDDQDTIGYVTSNFGANVWLCGMHADGATAFYNSLKGLSNMWQDLMSESCTHFGCGFEGDVWEAACTNVP